MPVRGTKRAIGRVRLMSALVGQSGLDMLAASRLPWSTRRIGLRGSRAGQS